MTKRHLLSSCALWLGLVIFSPVESRADQITELSFDTSSLVGHGAFFINFQLTNGDAASSNTATLTSLNFGGGAIGQPGSVQTVGGASGSLGSGTVTLADTEFLNDFLQAFAPGPTLGFRLTLSPPSFSGGTPDQFTFAILDRNFEEVATSDPLGTNVLLRVDINSSNPAVEQFSQSARPIYEPATMLLLGTGLAGIGGMIRKRRQGKAK